MCHVQCVRRCPQTTRRKLALQYLWRDKSHFIPSFHCQRMQFSHTHTHTMRLIVAVILVAVRFVPPFNRGRARITSWFPKHSFRTRDEHTVDERRWQKQKSILNDCSPCALHFTRTCETHKLEECLHIYRSQKTRYGYVCVCVCVHFRPNKTNRCINSIANQSRNASLIQDPRRLWLCIALLPTCHHNFASFFSDSPSGSV